MVRADCFSEEAIMKYSSYSYTIPAISREQFPNKLAVVCESNRLTYAQFADRVARLAGALLAAGAQSGDRIAFLSTNCHRLLEAYYGILEAGCVPASFDYTAVRARIGIRT
jgi:acyl-CoA synthetase (AMP-forming)/AMP-acid ligase II